MGKDQGWRDGKGDGVGRGGEGGGWEWGWIWLRTGQTYTQCPRAGSRESGEGLKSGPGPTPRPCVHPF